MPATRVVPEFRIPDNVFPARVSDSEKRHAKAAAQAMKAWWSAPTLTSSMAMTISSAVQTAM